MRDTSSSLKTDLDRYETNQLKMSAALLSMEVFPLNMSLSKCSKTIKCQTKLFHILIKLRKSSGQITKFRGYQ